MGNVQLSGSRTLQPPWPSDTADDWIAPKPFPSSSSSDDEWPSGIYFWHLFPFGVNVYRSAYCAGQIATQNNITNAHSIVQTYMVTKYNNVKHDIDNFTEWYGQPLNCSKTFPVLNIVIVIIGWVNLPRPHHPDDWTAFDTEYRNINATQQTVMRTMVTTMMRLIHREEKILKISIQSMR